MPEAKKTMPFVKWPGGKRRSLDFIIPKLPKSETLIEPFLGSGAIFLNTEYDNYILNDKNIDLINLYLTLKKEKQEFIKYCQSFFTQKNNREKKYYAYREEFNFINDRYKKAALFLYLNRHGFNGLCRYNQKGGYNVPFGSYNKPYFPETEMQAFILKAKRAKFHSKCFSEIFKLAKKDDTIYCDPPYLPINKTSNFTDYYVSGFGLEQQKGLAQLASAYKTKGNFVAISNHKTPISKKLYKGCTIYEQKLKRVISSDIHNRNYVTEILAIF